METSRTPRATVSLKHLCKVFERSEAALVHSLPIRKTICGIWSPTPVRVIEEAVTVLEDIGLLGGAARQRTLVDAGTGEVESRLCLLRFIHAARLRHRAGPGPLCQASVNLQRLQPECARTFIW